MIKPSQKEGSLIWFLVLSFALNAGAVFSAYWLQIPGEANVVQLTAVDINDLPPKGDPEEEQPEQPPQPEPTPPLEPEPDASTFGHNAGIRNSSSHSYTDSFAAVSAKAFPKTAKATCPFPP